MLHALPMASRPAAQLCCNHHNPGLLLLLLGRRCRMRMGRAALLLSCCIVMFDMYMNRVGAQQLACGLPPTHRPIMICVHGTPCATPGAATLHPHACTSRGAPWTTPAGACWRSVTRWPKWQQLSCRASPIPLCRAQHHDNPENQPVWSGTRAAHAWGPQARPHTPAATAGTDEASPSMHSCSRDR